MEDNRNILKKLKELTNWDEIAPLKYYKLIKSQDNLAKWIEMNKCSICLCELYDDIEDDEEEKNQVERDRKVLQNIKKYEKQFKKEENSSVIQEVEQNELEIVILPECKGTHCFHKSCLVNQKKSTNGDYIKCAICETTYGERIGDMPDGIMKWRTSNIQLEGFNKKSFEIYYHFDHGKINNVNYSGTSRTAYLPDNKEGKNILKMLIQSFMRRMTFIVGTSLTTGLQNTVVWAGIHHKTSPYGGPFGYPDKTYFFRVQEELKVRNIDLNSIKLFEIESRGCIEVKNGLFVIETAKGVTFK